jgi:hypothetical protein
VRYRADDEGRVHGIAALRVGDMMLYSDDGERRYRVGLLNEGETRMRTVEEMELDEAVVDARAAVVAGDRPLWRWFAWLAFAFLVVEWWAFAKPPRGVA